MRAAPTALLVLLSACGQPDAGEHANAAVSPAEKAHDVRAEFLGNVAGDAWANWPADLRGDPVDDGEECTRVAEQSREAAIRRLARDPAVRIDRIEYERLTGTAAPTSEGTLYLLRGFSTTNSAARVTANGDAVTVHSDALGGLFNPRRHPCIASLSRAPSAVYTVAAYDL